MHTALQPLPWKPFIGIYMWVLHKNEGIKETDVIVSLANDNRKIKIESK